MWDLADVGTIAPELSLHEDDDLVPRHRPRLLAFVGAWSIDGETPQDLARMRERIAELDAELVIVCAEGAWSFSREHDAVFCDRLAGDVATASAIYGVRACDAVFVIDHHNVIRFAHTASRPLTATISEALDAAAEAFRWRDHHTALERVQWTPREWASKSLVVGCSLTFSEDAPVHRSRFARGTGSVRACGSRPAITPRAEVGAPMPQSAQSDDRAHEPSPRRET